MLEMKTVGKPCAGKPHARFDEGELVMWYGCDIVTLTDERVRNSEYKLQPAATALVLYSTEKEMYKKWSVCEKRVPINSLINKISFENL